MTARPTCDAARTGLLLVDPYNDFLLEGGKLWPWVSEVAEQVGLIGNLKTVVGTAREKRVQVFVVLHHRWEIGDYGRGRHANCSQAESASLQLCAKSSWGGEWHSDFVPRTGDVVKDHWAHSGFANTDLDQQLKQHGVEKVVIIGLVANTCIESTGRFAMELGYHVTLVTDSTAAFSREMMRAAHDLNGPTYAHEILTTAGLVSALQAGPAAAT